MSDYLLDVVYIACLKSYYIYIRYGAIGLNENCMRMGLELTRKGQSTSVFSFDYEIIHVT